MKRKIRIGPIILLVGIYLIIGFSFIKLANVKIDRAKSEYAMKLLTENIEYPEKTREILIRASTEPDYAGKEIHVWDPDGRGYRSYDTYIGGGRLHWDTNSYIIPGKGEELGKVILKEKGRADFYGFFATMWLIGVPLFLLFVFTYEDSEDDNNRRNNHSRS